MAAVAAAAAAAAAAARAARVHRARAMREGTTQSHFFTAAFLFQIISRAAREGSKFQNSGRVTVTPELSHFVTLFQSFTARVTVRTRHPARLSRRPHCALPARVSAETIGGAFLKMKSAVVVAGVLSGDCKADPV